MSEFFSGLFWRIRKAFNPPPRHIPFKAEWEDWLTASLPLYTALPHDHRIKLKRKISEFIPSVYWEGAKGLELNEKMIVLIAAQACLLIINMEGLPFRRLKTVIVFPEAFVHESTETDEGGIHTDSRHRVSGLSFDSGTVSLAWKETQVGGRCMHDGYNLFFHEFSHQLDQASGYANGAPVLRRPEYYGEWYEVMRDEFERLIEDSSKGRVTLLDDYGAEDPAEFFAVATETFFEKARKMRKHYPDLYRVMKQYYQLDPAEWI